MTYTANHMIRHNGKLFHKGDEVPLTYEDAQDLLKHRAVTQHGRAEKAAAEEQVAEKVAAEKKAQDKVAVGAGGSTSAATTKPKGPGE